MLIVKTGKNIDESYANELFTFGEISFMNLRSLLNLKNLLKS